MLPNQQQQLTVEQTVKLQMVFNLKPEITCTEEMQSWYDWIMGPKQTIVPVSRLVEVSQ